MLDREEQTAPVLLGVDRETYLRRFVLNDAPLVVTTVQEHAAYIGRTEKWAYGMQGQPDPETIMRTVGLLDDDERREPYGLFHQNRLVGSVALHSFGVNYAKLGYWRIDDPEVRGKGLITRSARQVAHMAFKRLGLAAIGIEMTPDNASSRHVAERLGATFVARDADERLVYLLTDSD